MISRGEKMKETILLVLLSIILPSFDVYSDLALIYKFFQGVPSNQYCDEKYPCCGYYYKPGVSGKGFLAPGNGKGN